MNCCHTRRDFRNLVIVAEKWGTYIETVRASTATTRRKVIEHGNIATKYAVCEMLSSFRQSFPQAYDVHLIILPKLNHSCLSIAYSIRYLSFGATEACSQHT